MAFLNKPVCNRPFASWKQLWCRTTCTSQGHTINLWNLPAPAWIFRWTITRVNGLHCACSYQHHTPASPPTHLASWPPYHAHWAARLSQHLAVPKPFYILHNTPNFHPSPYTWCCSRWDYMLQTERFWEGQTHSTPLELHTTPSLLGLEHRNITHWLPLAEQMLLVTRTV